MRSTTCGPHVPTASPAALTKFGVAAFADNAYRAAGPTIAFPSRRAPKPLPNIQKQVNAAHARNRGPGERAMATLKAWKILTKLGCSPHRASTIIAAILAIETAIYQQKRG